MCEPDEANCVRVDPTALGGDEAEASPSLLRAYVIVKEPKMVVMPNFLDAKECSHLISLCEGSWVPSQVGSGTEEEYQKNKLTNQVTGFRSSWSCMLRVGQTSIVEGIEARIAFAAGLPIDQLERLHLVRYAPGETFKTHHDGKFRPKTVFIYLNDLAHDETGGGTMFPNIGISIIPRQGAFVMWPNLSPDGIELDEVYHAALPTNCSIKYGVNCFFNENKIRFTQSQSDTELENSVKVVVRELASDIPDEPNQLTRFLVFEDPKITAIPCILNDAEVAHLLGFVENANSREDPHTCFELGGRMLCMIGQAATETVANIELRFAAAGLIHVNHLGSLRVVYPATRLGLCNRGTGPRSMYVCLCEQEHVFFPKLGLFFCSREG